MPRRNRAPRLIAALLLAVSAALPCAAAPPRGPVGRAERPAAAGRLELTPGAPALVRAGLPHRLLITHRLPDGTTQEVTARAAVTLRPEGIVRYAAGELLALRNGGATLTAAYRGLTASARVTVSLPTAPPAPSFLDDVLPVLTRAGCNQGACHGAASGKNGFHLSLLGYDPEQDYQSLVRQGGGRRVQRTDPHASLVLRKAVASLPHQGGARFPTTSLEYRVLAEWIAAGAPGPAAAEPAITGLQVAPPEAVLSPGAAQRLLVTATYADGRRRDVTALSRFVSNHDPVAGVDAAGTVRMVGSGEAVVRASFRGQVAITRLAVPFLGAAPPSGDPWSVAGANPLDRAILEKLRRLRIVPAPPAGAAALLRRAYLDLTGTLPSPEEARAYLDSREPDKYLRLVDRLLASPEFVDAWTYRAGDWLRNTRRTLGVKGNRRFHEWLRDQIAANRPWDQLVRELLTARGSLWEHGPANFFGTASGPNEWAEATSQLFLGVRLGCARCHDHPFDRWTQQDYYQLAAFFARTGVKRGGERGDPVVVQLPEGEVKHPRSEAVLAPRTLDGKGEPAEEDRRQALAEWLTSPENPWFARNVANRIWKHLMGRGLVEPVDDVRATNPASNEAALQVLSAYLVEHDFDTRALIRLIVNSRVYRQGSEVNPSNRFDVTQFSRHVVRRLTAEQILDSLVAATGVPEKFPGVPLGPRAAQLPDTSVPSFLLDLFGRPARESACECERESEPNLAQVLHIMNGESIHRRISAPNSRLARLLAAGKGDAEIIEELFLATLTRRPTARERDGVLASIAASGARQETLADLHWALLNSRAFLFTH